MVGCCGRGDVPGAAALLGGGDSALCQQLKQGEMLPAQKGGACCIHQMVRSVLYARVKVKPQLAPVPVTESASTQIQVPAR